MNEFIAGVEPFVVGDRTYQASPLTLKDLRSLELYLRQQPILFVSPLLLGLDSESKEMLLKQAMQQSRQIELGNDSFNTELKTLKGMTYALFLSLQKQQPKIQLNEVADMVTIERVTEVAPLIARMIAGEKLGNPQQGT